MKPTRYFFCMICLLFLTVPSQKIYAQTTTYISHTIKDGETLSALAKQYHTTVGDIMRLNKMNTQSVLSIGEVVKIPVAKTTTVALKTVVPAPAATTSAVTSNGQPIIHIVKPGESLYTLSKKYNTTITKLKTWNKMAGDVIVDGHKLIVGYTLAQTQTPITVGAANIIADTTTAQPQTAAVIQKADSISSPTEEKIADTTHFISAPQTTANIPEQSVFSTDTTATVISQPSVKQPVVNTTNISPEGYFTPLFGVGVEGRSIQTISGNSMTFKTASGWTDKKYYILMNNVPPGSIVKIFTNNTVIYAKVLWSMSDIKENTGIDFRISTAAAAALGLSDAKFPLTITYYE